MKKILFTLLLVPSVLFGQEKPTSCSHLKSNRGIHAKSNTFSVAQIAETEEYDVHYYYLDLNMTNTTTTLSGSSEMHATALVAMDSALLEFFPTFIISSITVDGLPVTYSRINSAIHVPVNKNAGENFVVHVNYSGTPPTAATNPLGGGGMTNASSPSWGNQVTWSLSEPFSAFEWFPVKQSLTDKADSCAVWITVPTACKAGSNGVLEQVVNLGGGLHRFEWKHRHAIDYYLISVAVAQYVEYNVTANPVGSGPVLIQNFIYNNPATLPNFQDEIDETIDFIELFAELYGPYPFADEKYGHCMAPIGGGMEHQTMTTQGFFNASLTAHELAHQWWGNHVTCASWADIWLNEGFASYSEYLMLANLYPGQQGADMQDRHDNVMSQPDGSVWVLDSLDEGAIFSGRLSYDKGAAIIHTLRFLINNDSLFFVGLKDYQNQYSHSTAKGVDFIQVMENVSGMNFTNYLQEWYFGEGYPTYSVRWNKFNDSVLVEINHITSAPSITPTFTNDLELRFDRVGAPDTTMRFQNTGNQNQFLIPDGAKINNILSIDPANWIINDNGTIVKDLNFLVALEELAFQPELILFPNPTEGWVKVQMHTKGNYQLVVRDMTGRIILSDSFSENTQINLSTQAQGSYLVEIQDLLSGQKHLRLVKR